MNLQHSKARPIKSSGPAVACFLLLAMVSMPLHATILSYGGDPSPVTTGTWDGFYNVQSTLNFADQIYGNFTIPVGETWRITAVYGQIGDPDPAAQTPLANWDIRTGMSTSSMGTDVAHGTSTNSTTTWVSFAEAINGETSLTLTVNLSSTPVFLTGGKTYYLSVQPIDSSDFNMFLGIGTGTNQVGTQTEIFYYTMSNFPGDIVSTANYASLGVLGTESTPEPGTLTLAGSMLAALLLFRRRSR
jgi:hypothetical protein